MRGSWTGSPAADSCVSPPPRGGRPSVERVEPDDLHTADGLWLISSVRLLTPIVAVDGKPRDNGDLTAELAELLELPGVDAETR